MRIALNLKGLPYEMVSIHLTKDGGRQRTPEFRAVNPQKALVSPRIIAGIPGGTVAIEEPGAVSLPQSP